MVYKTYGNTWFLGPSWVLIAVGLPLNIVEYRYRNRYDTDKQHINSNQNQIWCVIMRKYMVFGSIVGSD